jgi:hypothetical protein
MTPLPDPIHTPAFGSTLSLWRAFALPCFAAAAVAGTATPAHAVDGCQVLLCFAASDWRKVPQCVPPVRQVLRDLARGRSFPTCSMSGAGNSAQHNWAAAPTNCPPQYTRLVETDTGSYYTCDYAGAISVVVDGAPFAKTWWNMGGDTVTEFSPVAKAQLGTWDTRYDDDYRAWATAQPAAPVDPSMP